jgi:hypothetical protein
VGEGEGEEKGEAPAFQCRSSRTSTDSDLFADPRSQRSSSMHVGKLAGKLAGKQYETAPSQRASKMRTGSHFDNKISISDLRQ